MTTTSPYEQATFGSKTDWRVRAISAANLHLRVGCHIAAVVPMLCLVTLHNAGAATAASIQQSPVLCYVLQSGSLSWAIAVSAQLGRVWWVWKRTHTPG